MMRSKTLGACSLIYNREMKQRQRIAIEKITGQSREWHPEAVKTFFAFTDRGERSELLRDIWRNQDPERVFTEAEQDLWELMQAHTFHPVDVELWKRDFKDGLLSLEDFIGEGHPDTFIGHACDIFKSVHGFVPAKYEKYIIGRK